MPDDIFNSRRWRDSGSAAKEKKHPNPSSSLTGGDPEWRRKPPEGAITHANQLHIIGLEHPNPSFSPAGGNVINPAAKPHHFGENDGKWASRAMTAQLPD